MCVKFFQLQVSVTVSHKEARHILINHEGDAAGGSDADHVGDDAFVETEGAFVPVEIREKKEKFQKLRQRKVCEAL